MKAELNKELEDDKAVQELLECWCTTGVKEKTKPIELAQSRIAELEAALGEALAKINELKSKRKATQEEQYADQKALDESDQMLFKAGNIAPLTIYADDFAVSLAKVFPMLASPFFTRGSLFDSSGVPANLSHHIGSKNTPKTALTGQVAK